jgi:predicted permease
MLVGLKLIVQPAVTAVMALVVLRMPAIWSSTAILLSALPTGTGPFMLATHYRFESAVSARAILLSTLFSVATVTGLLMLLLGPTL